MDQPEKWIKRFGRSIKNKTRQKKIEMLLKLFNKKKMKYIDDEEYGVMWLVKITGTDWYIQIEEDYPSYVKIERKNGKDVVLEATRDLPDEVSKLMG